MLRYQLIHPPLLNVLASAGHGSTVLLADANYPHSTGSRSGAPLIHLNLSPGAVPVDQVLQVLLDTVEFEAAAVMQPDNGDVPTVFATFTALLGGMALEPLTRQQFYAAARGPDLAVTVATGDQRLYANILLTIGVVPPAQTRKQP